MAADYIFLAFLLAMAWLGFRSGRRKKEERSKIAFVLLNLLALASVLLLLPLLEGLLSPREAVLRDLIDMSLYVAGLPLLILPIAVAASWVVGFAISQLRSRDRT